MKWCVLVVLACVVLSALGDLPPPERSYKILILLPVASKSHRNVFMPIANALADRGHKVVMLSNLPPTTKHPNIHEVCHGLKDFDTDSINVFEIRKQSPGVFGHFQAVLPPIARKLYHVPSVKNLYERRKEFDIIIINHMFNEVAYPFAHEMPFITVSTPGMDYRQSAVLGNVLNPAYAPNYLKEFQLPMNVFTRATNIFFHLMLPIYWRKWAVVPPVQKEVRNAS
ncbi:UDP-glucosyltransferase 2-like [Oratosquilla oratoria]|uniref:UDP-glucosyltransferase 2-like n=1 Tax=Oratosquilla oratoria TaxID=337810 RepID=UPI003F7589D8